MCLHTILFWPMSGTCYHRSGPGARRRELYSPFGVFIGTRGLPAMSLSPCCVAVVFVWEGSVEHFALAFVADFVRANLLLDVIAALTAGRSCECFKNVFLLADNRHSTGSKVPLCCALVRQSSGASACISRVKTWDLGTRVVPCCLLC